MTSSFREHGGDRVAAGRLPSPSQSLERAGGSTCWSRSQRGCVTRIQTVCRAVCRDLDQPEPLYRARHRDLGQPAPLCLRSILIPIAFDRSALRSILIRLFEFLTFSPSGEFGTQECCSLPQCRPVDLIARGVFRMPLVSFDR